MFESEEELRKVALPILTDKLTHKDVHRREEFSYSGGRTDIVLSYVSDAYKRRRVRELGVDIPIENKKRLKIFLRLHKKDGYIQRDNFIEQISREPRKISNDLDWLIDHNFVIEDNGRIRTKPYLRRHITTSIAIELKLGKWQRAFRQALQGRAYSEYQYVVLDESNIHRALKDLSLFKKHEVGLISISKEGDFEHHYEPEKQSPYSELNVWRLNETTLLPSNTLGV
ncbi:hypothetical protein ACFR9U_15935 [Halorientalis brevis]|uniref:Uncharacterized protein n=1 Tax=Halorientalis brevis TaxID=1126241 RepID=A0ABD6CE48_9EURY|nr:hypothetical protein [Halorientalis brevis]